MFSFAISSLFQKFIPLPSFKILYANFRLDVPMTTVSTDNVNEDYIKKPKKWNIKNISDFLIIFKFISSIFYMITIALLFFLVNSNETLFRTAWFFESVVSEIIMTFAIRTKIPF
jgi:Mg2+-importing ATPase